MAADATPFQVKLPLADSAPNSYWDELKPYVVDPPTDPFQRMLYGGYYTVGSFRSSDGENVEDFEDRAVEVWRRRADWCRQYAWAIPDPTALKYVAAVSRGKLVDPMAGTGYWAYLLTWMGVEVQAYDMFPPAPGETLNHYHGDSRQFVRVQQGDAAEVVTRHPDHTLFLCWPPMSDAAAKAAKAYQGDRIIYIGESEGGCTADEEFFELMNSSWDDVDQVPIVSYAGLHDRMHIFDRRV